MSDKSDRQHLAGLAYLLTEQASLAEDMSKLEDHGDRLKRAQMRVTMYALRWAFHRDLPMGTDASAAEALADATTYRAEHEDDVADFVNLYEQQARERRVNGL